MTSSIRELLAAKELLLATLDSFSAQSSGILDSLLELTNAKLAEIDAAIAKAGFDQQKEKILATLDALRAQLAALGPEQIAVLENAGKIFTALLAGEQPATAQTVNNDKTTELTTKDKLAVIRDYYIAYAAERPLAIKRPSDGFEKTRDVTNFKQNILRNGVMPKDQALLAIRVNEIWDQNKTELENFPAQSVNAPAAAIQSARPDLPANEETTSYKLATLRAFVAAGLTLKINYPSVSFKESDDASNFKHRILKNRMPARDQNLLATRIDEIWDQNGDSIKLFIRNSAKVSVDAPQSIQRTLSVEEKLSALRAFVADGQVLTIAYPSPAFDIGYDVSNFRYNVLKTNEKKRPTKLLVTRIEEIWQQNEKALNAFIATAPASAIAQKTLITAKASPAGKKEKPAKPLPIYNSIRDVSKTETQVKIMRLAMAKLAHIMGEDALKKEIRDYLEGGYRMHEIKNAKHLVNRICFPCQIFESKQFVASVNSFRTPESQTLIQHLWKCLDASYKENFGADFFRDPEIINPATDTLGFYAKLGVFGHRTVDPTTKIKEAKSNEPGLPPGEQEKRTAQQTAQDLIQTLIDRKLSLATLSTLSDIDPLRLLSTLDRPDAGNMAALKEIKAAAEIIQTTAPEATESFVSARGDLNDNFTTAMFPKIALMRRAKDTLGKPRLVQLKGRRAGLYAVVPVEKAFHIGDVADDGENATPVAAGSFLARSLSGTIDLVVITEENKRDFGLNTLTL